MSRKDILEAVSMDLLSIPPLVFRAVRARITRTTLSEMEMDITPHQMEIIRLLSEEGTMHPSKIGERLEIARAQMTKLVDQLVKLKMVERSADAVDRRTLNITLSSEGKAILEEHKQKVNDAVREIMSSLTDEELGSLSQSLRNLRDLLLNTSESPSK
jgi:DNA-binding MarR family transcriptional regulator